MKYGLNIEIKATDPDARTFEGYASVFGNVDRTGDIVMKGAFGNVKAEDVKLHLEHSYAAIIGEILELKEDNHGLWVKGYIQESADAEEVYIAMKAGQYSAMSIGYRVKEAHLKNGTTDLIKIDLKEISIVADPANILATINSVKSNDSLTFTERELDISLRDAGVSRNQSNNTIHKLKSMNLDVRDAQRDDIDFDRVSDAMKGAGGQWEAVNFQTILNNI